MKSPPLLNGLAFGHIIECFDNTLYGFFSVLLAPVFFPSSGEFNQFLLTFGIFAAGYFSRPLGAVIFGLIGDRFGPKIALAYSIGLIGIPTFIIGCLPDASNVGVMVPAALLICRILQGILYGGEFAGAHVYVFETIPSEDHGKATGWLIASGVIGAIFASFSGILCLWRIFPDWSWRIPFIVGGMLSFLALHLRRSLEPLPRPHREVPYAQSLKTLWLHYKKSLIFCFMLSGLATIPLYLCTVYANKIYYEIGFNSIEAMGLNMLTMIFNAVLLIFYGWLADKIGFIKTIKFGCWAVVFGAIPGFWLVSEGGALWHAIGFVTILITIGTIINGCAFPYMAQLFPVKVRYSGLAISYTLGNGILSGISPFVATILSKIFLTELAVALYPITVALLTIYINKLWIIPLKASFIEVSFEKSEAA